MNSDSTDTAESTNNSSAIGAYSGRVPLGLKMIYAVGASSEAIIGVAFNAFNFFFYTNILGLPGWLAGLAITIALIFDAITDPLVGSISDRWQSRLGRRHPFMFAAPLPVMVCLFCIYTPPSGLEESGLFLWLTVFTVIMRSSMTLFHVPHLAMGAELSSDFTERTRVMSMNTLLGAFGGVAAIFIAYTFFFNATPEFSNGLLNASAYPIFAIGAAFIGGAIMLLSTVFTLQLIPRLPQPPKDIPKFSFGEFLRDIGFAFANRNYLFLMTAFLILSIMLGTRGTIGLHMFTYFWELLPEQIRYFALIGAFAPIIGFMVTATLHERFDKQPVIVTSVFLLTLFAGMPVCLRMVGLFPVNGSPYLVPSLLFIDLLALTAGVILLISVMSALADIADEHELSTHRRQEGIFYSARSFFAKATSGFGHLFAGIAISVIEFPVGAEPGSVDPDTVFKLGLVDGPIAVIPGFIAVGFYTQYKLTRKRHAEIQEQLRLRHQQNAKGQSEPTETPSTGDSEPA